MADPKITLSAVDQTKAAFDSARQNLRGLQDQAGALKAGLAALGIAGAAAAFVGTIKGAIEAADQLNKLSQRSGVATETLSQLQFAAQLSDVSTDSLASALKKLNVSIAEGIGGDKTKVEAFRNLGINLRDSAGQAITADKALLKIADSFSTAKDGAAKTSYAVALLGKAGDEMIPLLNGGGAAIEDLMHKADRLGLTISGDFAARSEEFNDNLTILNAASKRLAVSMADDVVIGLGKAAKAAADAAEKSGRLYGILVGLATLFGGDAQHQNNVSIVDQTDKILSLQDAIDKAREKGDNARAARLEGLLKAARGEVNKMLVVAKEFETAPPKAPVKDKNLKALDKTGDAQQTAALSYLAQLAKEYANLTGTGTKLAEVMEQLNIKGAKFTVDQRDQAMAMARKIDAFTATRKEMESQNQLLAAQDEILQRNEDAYTSVFDALRAFNREQKEQIEVLGMLPRDAEKVTYFRKVDAELLKAEAAALQGVNEGSWNQAEALRRMAAAQDIATQAKDNFLKVAGDKRDQETNPQRGVNDALRDYQDNLRRNGDAAREATTRTLGSMEDSLVAFVSTGKLSFSGLVDTIIAEFARLAVVRPLMQGLLGSGGAGALGALFGGGGLSLAGGGAAAAAGFTGGSLMEDLAAYGVFHAGGVVGDRAPARRYASPSLFDHAMKYHTGGLVGDEVPAILQRGEEVLTANDPRHRRNGGAGAQITYAPNINVDARADQAANVVLMRQVAADSQRDLVEQLRRQGFLP